MLSESLGREVDEYFVATGPFWLTGSQRCSSIQCSKPLVSSQCQHPCSVLGGSQGPEGHVQVWPALCMMLPGVGRVAMKGAPEQTGCCQQLKWASDTLKFCKK